MLFADLDRASAGFRMVLAGAAGAVLASYVSSGSLSAVVAVLLWVAVFLVI